MLDTELKAIRQGERLRPLHEPTVNALAESMKAVGLIQPIVIHRPKGISPYVVSGAHRLEAAKRLGWKTIPTVELPSTDELDAQLREIDENLVRAELTPAQRAKFMARKKELYELRYPETRSVNVKGGPGRGNKTSDKPVAGFTELEAERTGRARRTIERDVRRAKRIARLDETVGTSLDHGEQLEALSFLPPTEQDALIERAKKGEKVKVPTTAGDNRSYSQPLGSEFSPRVKQMRVLFNRCTREEKFVFVRSLAKEYGICKVIEMN